MRNLADSARRCTKLISINAIHPTDCDFHVSMTKFSSDGGPRLNPGPLFLHGLGSPVEKFGAIAKSPLQSHFGVSGFDGTQPCEFPNLNSSACFDEFRGHSDQDRIRAVAQESPTPNPESRTSPPGGTRPSARA